MDNSDPFASISGFCHVSSSQEKHLLHCHFAGEPDDDSIFGTFSEATDTPVDCTAIMMVSPPETPGGKRVDGSASEVDVFKTPPEESTQPLQQPVTVDLQAAEEEGNDGDCGGYSRAVDLGRDTDPEFSLLEELTEKIENPGIERGVINSESIENNVLTRELASKDDDFFVQQKKRLKIVDRCLESENLATDAEKVLDILTKSVEALKSLCKRSKILDKGPGSGTPTGSEGIGAEKIFGRLLKSMQKLKSPSKISDKDLASPTSGSSLGNKMDEINKLKNCVENSKCEKIGLDGGCLASPEVHRIGEMLTEGNDVEKDTPARRKLEFSTEVLESDDGKINAALGLNDVTVEGVCNEKDVIEATKFGNPIERKAAQRKIDDIDKFKHVSVERDSARSARRSIGDIDKFRYVGPSCLSHHKNKEHVGEKRMLPASVCGKEDAGLGETKPDNVENYKDFTLLDVLQLLANNSCNDPNLENLSLLEAAKRRGITFP